MRKVHETIKDTSREGIERKSHLVSGFPGQGLIVPAMVVGGALLAWQVVKDDIGQTSDQRGSGQVEGERTPGGDSQRYESTGQFQYIGSQAEVDSLVTDADREGDGRVEVVIGMSHQGESLTIRQRVAPRDIGGQSVVSYNVPQVVVMPNGDGVTVPENASIRIGRQAPRSLAEAIAQDVDTEGAGETSPGSISGLDTAYGTGGIPTTAQAGSMVDLTMTFGNRGSIVLDAQVVANDVGSSGSDMFVVGYYIPREATINGETFTVNPDEVTVSIPGSTATEAMSEGNFYRPLSRD